MPNSDELVIGKVETSKDAVIVKPEDKSNIIITNDEIVSKFGSDIQGAKLDDKGNLLDAENKIVKSKEDLDKLIQTGVQGDNKIIVDSVEYTLDKDGNAVLGDAVKFTKEQLDKFNSVTDNIPAINFDNVFKLTGVTVTDDKGTPVTYETNEQGYAKYVNDVSNIRGTEIAKQNEEAFFRVNPDIYQAYLHKVRTGSLENFNVKEDWSKKTVSDDENQQLDIIIKGRLAKGDSSQEAIEYANLMKTAGKSKEMADSLLIFLKGKDIAEETEAKQILAYREAEEQVAFNQFVTDVSTIVNNGKLEDIIIPESFKIANNGKTETYTRQDFINYFTMPAFQDDNGKTYTGDEAAIYNLSIVNRLKDALYRFLKGDTSQLVRAGIDKDKVNNIRKLVSNAAAGSAKRQISTGKSKIDNIII